jgi:hypothetical protein
MKKVISYLLFTLVLISCTSNNIADLPGPLGANDLSGRTFIGEYCVWEFNTDSVIKYKPNKTILHKIKTEYNVWWDTNRLVTCSAEDYNIGAKKIKKGDELYSWQFERNENKEIIAIGSGYDVKLVEMPTNCDLNYLNFSELLQNRTWFLYRASSNRASESPVFNIDDIELSENYESILKFYNDSNVRIIGDSEIFDFYVSINSDNNQFTISESFVNGIKVVELVDFDCLYVSKELIIGKSNGYFGGFALKALCEENILH